VPPNAPTTAAQPKAHKIEQPSPADDLAPDKLSAAAELTTIQWRKDHDKAITQAIADQKKMLLEKKAELTRWNPEDQDRFRRAFGKTDEKTRKIMQGRIDRMIDLNKNTTIENFTPAPPDDDNEFAHVTPSDPSKTIYLGKDFHTAPARGPNSKAGTLCHEMSHFDDIGGTDDLGYGTTEASHLAKKHPDNAVQNADNFEYYMEGALDPPPPPQVKSNLKPN
jgi:type VI secretion system secreted protein VgrG